jgi:hypothetical protein
VSRIDISRCRYRLTGWEPARLAPGRRHVAARTDGVTGETEIVPLSLNMTESPSEPLGDTQRLKTIHHVQRMRYSGSKREGKEARWPWTQR